MPPKYVSGDKGSAKGLAKLTARSRIRCSVCKKVKLAETYSKRQLGDFKHQIALGNDLKQSNIRCRLCTGSQTHEMTCAICGTTKPLEAFSKAQRHTPDRAVRLGCWLGLWRKALILLPSAVTFVSMNTWQRGQVLTIS